MRLAHNASGSSKYSIVPIDLSLSFKSVHVPSTLQNNDKNNKQKRHRTRFTPAQLNELERCFSKTHYPGIFPFSNIQKQVSESRFFRQIFLCAKRLRWGSDSQNREYKWVEFCSIISRGRKFSPKNFNVKLRKSRSESRESDIESISRDKKRIKY